MLELLANTTEFNFISGSNMKGVNKKKTRAAWKKYGNLA